MAIPTSYKYAIPTSYKYKEYARYAAHCLNMVAATKDQESRAINREMAARDMLEKLPLGQAHLMSFELIPIGPLNQLRQLQGMKANP